MKEKWIMVSEESGEIDWNAVEKGTKRLLLRVGIGTGTIDQSFRKNADLCEKRKIPFDVYWESYAFTPEMSKREAVQCLGMIEEYREIQTIVLYYGKNAIRYGRSRGAVTDTELTGKIIDQFCEEVKRNGYRDEFIIS